MKLFYVKPFSILLILLLGITVYSNTFFCSFQLDDIPYILNNPSITNLHNIQGIWNYFHGRFIVFLSIAFNYQVNGLNVFGYHLFNLAVHLGSAVLVWWLTLLTLSTPALEVPPEKLKGLNLLKVPSVERAGGIITIHCELMALFAGLIFVAHPLQTEAVTYISQRAASMAALFYLASICLYVKSRFPQGNRQKLVFYLGSLTAAVLAMFCKENTVTLPLMILLYEIIFLKNEKSIDWRYIAPFLLTVFIVPATFLFIKSQSFQQMHGDLRVNGGLITPWQYFLTQFRVMFTYVRLVFIPIRQNVDYDYPVFKNFFELPVLLSFLLLMIIFNSALRIFSKYKIVAFSIIWFFLTIIIPESSFWVMGDIVQEHRLYLPLAGFSMFFVSGVFYLLGKDNLKLVGIVLSLTVVFYSVLTYERNKLWIDEFTLWSDAVQKSPFKARPYNNRGICFAKKGDLTRAIQDFDKAIELDPVYAEAYNDRGGVFARKGDYVKALSDLNRAIELMPFYKEAYFNEGVVNFKLGHLNQARFDYTKSIEIDPANAEAYNNRGSVEGAQKNFFQAFLDFTKAIELDPGFAEAYFNRAEIYFTLDKYDNAWEDVRNAEKFGYSVNPQFLNALNRALGKGE